MQALLKKLEEKGIKTAFLILEYPGYYCHETNILFINQNQSEEQQKRVIFHELKHHLDHSEFIMLYNSTVPRLKMESEANDYMIRKIIDDNGGIYNYTQLVEDFKIGMGNDIKYANF